VYDSGVRIQADSNEFLYHPTIVLNDTLYIMFYQSYKSIETNIHEQPINAMYLTNYPNPFHNKTSIIIPQEYFKTGNSILLKVYDISGKLLITNVFQASDKIILNRNGLNPGLYFYSIEQENIISRNGKFIIE